MVYCVRKLNWKKAPTQIKSFRNYANYNSDDFCNDLEGVNWNSVSNPNGRSGSVEALWADFKHKFVTVAGHHAPIIQKRVRGIDNCPWLNKNIKLNMRQRDYFLGKARKTNHSEDWSNYKFPVSPPNDSLAYLLASTRPSSFRKFLRKLSWSSCVD